MAQRSSQISLSHVIPENEYGLNFQSRPNPRSGFTVTGTEATLEPNQEALLMAVSQSASRFNEEWDASQRGDSILYEPTQISSSVILPENRPLASRGTILMKTSNHRGSIIKKLPSRRSSRASSVHSLVHQGSDGIDEKDSIFFSPIPTNGNPTELLVNRFQAWRRVLKDIITYFKEIQASYDQRAKSLQKVSNILSNSTPPPDFLQSSGIYDATSVLKTYYKTLISEATKSKDIENEVIYALVGLRSDLQQKIKEIKNLSGDFRNSLEKEMESTRKALNELHESLGLTDTGKRDPYLLKLATDHLIEKQIAEENYLHQAYLNLEASGRELEAIIVGEIQKSYIAFSNILRRETEVTNYTFEELHVGPIAMPKDHEWDHFIKETNNFVDPNVPMRSPHNIKYPGRDHELVQQIRAGLLERKSKYLKSYTAGWYVLTPTHLHEFKSVDKSQAPVMSLNLSEQKLSLFSNSSTTSNKFVLKGRQTGVMHRGHSWVFRCESYETTISWYETLKELIDISHQGPNTRVSKHIRSSSGASQTARSIYSSDGGLDEEDEEPFSSKNPAIETAALSQEALPKRPQAGGRFPSTDLLLNKPHQRDTKILCSQSNENSTLGEVQDLNPKTAEYISEDEIPIESFDLINQNTQVDDTKSDSDKNEISKQEKDINRLLPFQLSDNFASERQVENCDNEIQQRTFVKRSPENSRIDETHSTGIDSNYEVKEENADKDKTQNSILSNHARANLDGVLELVQSEDPQTHCAPDIPLEK
ncbi:Phosphatidylinositol 4,5-bisphosphate-binding protein SLM2 [Erysiphe neolycopersici]|uniref:Phosphatidylinositol 4,5-bisphosphate-binding protein SLM2 n=1 Tax=Erysiphe neolycopersici TaxID=212602 RepID=A0A420HX69_9PEZI|nr:Phosphatidylinositol 4,5-bisphosphate-binding protein SLM2 [Erysiphe neolycopersici]